MAAARGHRDHVQRAGRGIRLTDAGRLLAERAAEVIGRLDAAENELAAYTGLRAGRLRLAAFPSALGTIVPAAAASLRGTNPGLDLDDFIGLSFATFTDGKLYQLPDQQFANLYWFRYDWFSNPDYKAKFKAKYGYDLGVPVNWSAYEDIAEFFTNDVIRGLLANSLETAALTPEGFKDVGKGPGSTAAEFVEWLTIPDQRQAVVDDVQRIRTHPLVPKSIPVYGYIYDVKSGKLIEVGEATTVGAAS